MKPLTPIEAQGLSAYVALPAAGCGPLLLVLQEIFGVNRNIRELCDLYAEEGYVAVAPDLFWRQGIGIDIDPGAVNGMERALACLDKFDDVSAMRDINATIDFAQKAFGCQGPVAAVG